MDVVLFGKNILEIVHLRIDPLQRLDDRRRQILGRHRRNPNVNVTAEFDFQNHLHDLISVS